MKTIKMTQDKVVKHSVRYGMTEGTISMSVYVPKEILVGMMLEQGAGTVEAAPKQNGFPQHLTITLSLGDGK